VPCIDSIWEKCTWEFEFVVPRHLEESEDGTEEEDDTQGSYPTVVVCSGELVQQVRQISNPVAWTRV
jgi:transcription initiation factor TFIID subunit 2